LQKSCEAPIAADEQQQRGIARRDAGEALTEIGQTFGVSHSTISRLRDWLPRNGLAEGSQ
jgi:hypothetical protein